MIHVNRGLINIKPRRENQSLQGGGVRAVKINGRGRGGGYALWLVELYTGLIDLLILSPPDTPPVSLYFQVAHTSRL